MQMVNLSAVALAFAARGGQPTEANLVRGYGAFTPRPGVYGLSVVFHPGYTLDQLLRVAQFPHSRVGYATIAEVEMALTQAGYELVLTKTPTRKYVDHHTLGVAQGGVALRSLPADAARALTGVLHEIPNPYIAP